MVLSLKKASTVTMSTGHRTKCPRLCSKNPSTTIFPLNANRSILSSPNSDYSREQPPLEVKYEHPYDQTRGPGNVLSVDIVDDDTLVRVIMPGVGEDGYKVWVENNKVFFEGTEEMELKSDQNSRTYRGGIVFHGMLGDIVEVRTEMKNGILVIRIPDLKNMLEHHL